MMIDLSTIFAGTEFEDVFKPIPRKGDGAKFVHFPEAKNGHIFGYNTQKDAFGKWYAIEYAPLGPGARSGKGKARKWKLKRLVKCATRTKARAKASDWYWTACGKKKVSA